VPYNYMLLKQKEMKKRNFIKILSLGALGTIAFASGLWSCNGSGHKSGHKTWAWVHPNQPPDADKTDDEWKLLLGNLKKWGIDAVLLLVRNKSVIDQVLPIASATGLELHAWIVTMEWPDEITMKEHPSWYVVNGRGESCIDKPPYIDEYRWLCPSNPEVTEFTKKRVSDLYAYSELAGIHLDYIRYPDVVLAPFHRAKYDIPQDELIHPQFDYCYCEICRDQFRQISGLDPLTLADQSTNEAWRDFRHNSITKLVDEIYDLIHKNGKVLSAAVFPTPELAKMRVRQDWVNWKLDYVMPMIYHKYEMKPVEWIEMATREGVKALSGKIPLYSGLHLYQLTPEELGLAAALSVKAGASGLALFTGNKMSEAYWKCIVKK
jgi:uncharacterized lipoprotein YddW (UPF0748 family)